MYNLETRAMVFEDIGRQVLSQGFRNPAQFYLQEIGEFSSSEFSCKVINWLKWRLISGFYLVFSLYRKGAERGRREGG
jgi:hypothetical protein